MNSYKKMLKITKAIINYSMENIDHGEIIYINDIKHLQVIYKDKEALFIDIND